MPRCRTDACERRARRVERDRGDRRRDRGHRTHSPVGPRRPTVARVCRCSHSRRARRGSLRSRWTHCPRCARRCTKGVRDGRPRGDRDRRARAARSSLVAGLLRSHARDPAATARARRRARSRPSGAPHRSCCGRAAICRATAPGSDRPPISPAPVCATTRCTSPSSACGTARCSRSCRAAASRAATFWEAFADPATLGLPADVRLVVVTKDAAGREPAARCATSRRADLAVVHVERGVGALRGAGLAVLRAGRRHAPAASSARAPARRGRRCRACSRTRPATKAALAARRRGRHRSAHRPRAARARHPARATRACTATPTRSSADAYVITGAPSAPTWTADAARRARLAVELRPGWEGRILRRTPMHREPSTTHAVVHLASFPLPEARGDFGVGRHRAHAFAATSSSRCSSTDPSRSGHADVRGAGHPAPHRRPVRPRRLQRTLPGQLGCQLFFTASDRPFCLYVVVAGRCTCRAIVARGQHGARGPGDVRDRGVTE